MIKPLSPELIAAIRASQDGVVATARQLGVSTASVSRYRPVHRRHINDDELDQIVSAYVMGKPVTDIAKRVGVSRSTVYEVLNRAVNDLLNGPQA